MESNGVEERLNISACMNNEMERGKVENEEIRKKDKMERLPRVNNWIDWEKNQARGEEFKDHCSS